MPLRVAVCITPHTGEDKSREYVRATLELEAGACYPAEPPHISLSDVKGARSHCALQGPLCHCPLPNSTSTEADFICHIGQVFGRIEWRPCGGDAGAPEGRSGGARRRASTGPLASSARVRLVLSAAAARQVWAMPVRRRCWRAWRRRQRSLRASRCWATWWRRLPSCSRSSTFPERPAHSAWSPRSLKPYPTLPARRSCSVCPATTASTCANPLPCSLTQFRDTYCVRFW